jgi:hypothetical protein
MQDEADEIAARDSAVGMGMKGEIEVATAALVGMPLWSSGRAGLQWFAFGDRRTVTTRKGTPKEVGELALHVQCWWRIVRVDTIVVGSGDLYFPADEAAEAPDDFDPNGVVTRLDHRVTQLFERETRAFTVRQVDVGAAGALRIVLDDGLALEVFPDESVSREAWRLFRPYSDAPHLVVTGTGIER